MWVGTYQKYYYPSYRPSVPNYRTIIDYRLQLRLQLHSVQSHYHPRAEELTKYHQAYPGYVDVEATGVDYWLEVAAVGGVVGNESNRVDFGFGVWNDVGILILIETVHAVSHVELGVRWTMMMFGGSLKLLPRQRMLQDRWYDILFSSSSSRYFAFFRTPSVHCCPIPFFTHLVQGRSICQSSQNSGPSETYYHHT